MLSPKLLWEVERALWLVATGLGVQAARLGFLASKEKSGKREQRRLWYDAKWTRIRESSFLRLPEIVIRWLLSARDSLARRNFVNLEVTVLFLCPVFLGTILWLRANQLHSVHPRYGSISITIGVVLYLAGLVVAAVGKRIACSLLMSVLTGFGIFVIITYGLDRYHANSILLSLFSAWLDTLLLLEIIKHQSKEHVFLENVTDGLLSVLVLVMGIIVALLVYGLTVWLQVITTSPIGRSVLISVLMFPVVGTSIAIAPAWLTQTLKGAEKGVGTTVASDAAVDRAISSVLLFGYAVAFSFTVTLSAIFIGHLLEPLDWLPQTPRMLLSNAVCDGITVVTTLYLLELGVARRRHFPLPIAISLTGLVGVVLACASLWFGVKQVTVQQIGRVLIGRSVSNDYWEFGPYFWTMHTVLIPLLFYLALVVFCWMAKAVVAARERFYNDARDAEINGLNMTARLLSYMAVVIGGIAGILKFLE